MKTTAAEANPKTKSAFQSLLTEIRGGKKVSTDTYFHIDHPSVLIALSTLARGVERPGGTNVLRIGLHQSGPTISFLKYQSFFEDPFPSLMWSHHITLDSGLAVLRREGNNPAILHRKELLLTQDHPRRGEFEALTNQLIEFKLLPAKSFIGRRNHWNEYLRKNGFAIRSGCLCVLEAS